MKRKYFFILLTVIVYGNAVRAQSAEDSVKLVINKMFTAMKEGNGEMLRSTFADSMVLQTIVTDKQGKLVVLDEHPSGFIDFVSKQSAGNADERITFDIVKVDGPLAIAWTPYRFYWKGKFHHCGVNSFQLVRFENQWKIQYLIDTRKETGCGE